jgi:Phytanoyl-CoA dioxygenase (PhyH)
VTPARIAELVASRGYAIAPGFLSADDIAPAVAEIPLLFPSADEFADDVDPRRNDRFRAGQFGGVDVLPFASLEWNLLSVHPRLLDVAEAVLGSDDLRLYRAEAWAKYSQAVDYDQSLHRDFLNHSLVVPTDDPRFGQVEMFLYLTDMASDLGPTHVVPTHLTAHIPAIPNHLGADEHPDLYEQGELVLGPPGTLLVYRTDLVHRGTAISRARAARFTLHLNLRTAAAEWANRSPWGDTANRPAWAAFVERCTPRELSLFGFPPPGHPYWNDLTLAGVSSRYPGLDMSPWWSAPH